MFIGFISKLFYLINGSIIQFQWLNFFNNFFFFFLQQWELIVLNKLKWNISSVTPLDFLEHLLVRLPINKQHTDVSKIKKHAQAFISLAARGKFLVR